MVRFVEQIVSEMPVGQEFDRLFVKERLPEKYRKENISNLIHMSEQVEKIATPSWYISKYRRV
jgi:hypothetical protein